MSKQLSFDYKIQARYLLSKSFFGFFDVIGIREIIGIMKETNDECILLHIYLDEKDTR